MPNFFNADEVSSELRPLAELTEKLERLIRTRLWVQIVVAMFSGIGDGMLLSPSWIASWT